jgi:hypothetical protein
MIVLAAAMMMAAPAAPAAPSRERNALGTCLQKAIHDRLADKMNADAFKTAAKTACSAQATAFRAAWVSYDVAMKTPRTDAEQNADSQVEDYLQNTTDSYVDDVNPPQPKSTGPASPVMPASSTTPPKP